MEFNNIKQSFLSCPDLAGLDDASRACLFLRGEVVTLAEGTAIYTEGKPLDDTFGLLLSDYLVVERSGVVVAQISKLQIFGEVAYFTHLHIRTATVRAGWPQATILKFQLSPRDLETPSLQELKRYLGLQAWERFVSASQNEAPRSV
jgi:hypothetical protein